MLIPGRIYVGAASSRDGSRQACPEPTGGMALLRHGRKIFNGFN